MEYEVIAEYVEIDEDGKYEEYKVIRRPLVAATANSSGDTETPTETFEDLALAANVECYFEDNPPTEELPQQVTIKTEIVDNDEEYIPGKPTTTGKKQIRQPRKRTYRSIPEEEGSSFACDLCGKGFSSQKYLSAHLATHYEKQKVEKRFQCEFCEARFPYQSVLKRHQEIHSKDKTFLCEICKKTFYLERYLKAHMLLHMNRTKPHKCDVCGKGFQFPSYLAEHRKIHSAEWSLIVFQCNRCGRRFKREKDRNFHEKRCDLTRSRRALRGTQNQGPFFCPICEKIFKRNKDRNFHAKRCAKKESSALCYPHACGQCSKRFPCEEELEEHMEAKHKMLNCDFCSKEFANPSKLKMHLRIHTGEKPYECHICHKLYRYRSNWRDHLATHTNSKPYSCNLCQKKFSYYSDVSRHTKKCHLAYFGDAYLPLNKEEETAAEEE